MTRLVSLAARMRHSLVCLASIASDVPRQALRTFLVIPSVANTFYQCFNTTYCGGQLNINFGANVALDWLCCAPTLTPAAPPNHARLFVDCRSIHGSSHVRFSADRHSESPVDSADHLSKCSGMRQAEHGSAIRAYAFPPTFVPIETLTLSDIPPQTGRTYVMLSVAFRDQSASCPGFNSGATATSFLPSALNFTYVNNRIPTDLRIETSTLLVAPFYDKPGVYFESTDNGECYASAQILFSFTGSMEVSSISAQIQYTPAVGVSGTRSFLWANDPALVDGFFYEILTFWSESDPNRIGSMSIVGAFSNPTSSARPTSAVSTPSSIALAPASLTGKTGVCSTTVTDQGFMCRPSSTYAQLRTIVNSGSSDCSSSSGCTGSVNLVPAAWPGKFTVTLLPPAGNMFVLVNSGGLVTFFVKFTLTTSGQTCDQSAVRAQISSVLFNAPSVPDTATGIAVTTAVSSPSYRASSAPGLTYGRSSTSSECVISGEFTMTTTGMRNVSSVSIDVITDPSKSSRINTAYSVCPCSLFARAATHSFSPSWSRHTFPFAIRVDDHAQTLTMLARSTTGHLSTC
jgi:hypothetical protein